MTIRHTFDLTVNWQECSKKTLESVGPDKGELNKRFALRSELLWLKLKLINCIELLSLSATVKCGLTQCHVSLFKDKQWKLKWDRLLRLLNGENHRNSDRSY